MNDIDIEKLKDLKAVYSGAVQAGEISIAEIIKNAIDLIETLIAENKELKEMNDRKSQEIWKYQKTLENLQKKTIWKSKLEEEIDGKFKEAKGLYERGVQPQAQYTMKLLKDLEQSLLGKE